MEKTTHKTYREQLQSKKSIGLMIILMGFIFLISINFISALEFDNIKSFDEGVGKYGKVTIDNWFGFGDTLTTLELKENTDVCVFDCSAELEIIMYKDGILIDEVRFMKLQEDKSWLEGRVRSFQFYIIEGDDKIPYELGTEVKIGTYYVKLEGVKNPRHTIDWQVTSQGKLIEDWRPWVEGDLVTSWNTNSVEPRSVFTDNTNVFVLFATKIEKYTMEGDFVNNCDLNTSNVAAFGADTNGTNIFTSDLSFDHLFTYNMTIDGGNCGYIKSVLLNAGNEASRDLSTNGTVIRVIEDSPNSYYDYTMNGVDIKTDTLGGGDQLGITTFKNFMYLTESALDLVTRNYTNVSSRGLGNIELDAANGDALGIGTNGFYLWVTDNVDDKIYQYFTGLEDIGVSLIVPSDDSFSIDTPMFFNSSATAGEGFNFTNATIQIYNSEGILINETTKIVLGNLVNSTNFNISNLIVDTLTWNVLWCVDDSAEIVCDTAPSNRTLIYGIEEVSIDFNSTVLETSNQNFVLSLDVLSGFNVQKANLIYNDEIFSGATIISSGINFNITQSITIPQGVQGFSSEDRIFIFNVSIADDIIGTTTHILTSENTQTVNEIGFGLCDGIDLDVPMLNFTMINEITNVELNASKNASTFQATFILGLNEDDLIKNFSFSEVLTNVSRFNFCTGDSTNVFIVDMSAFYTAVSFTEKTYFLNKAVLSNNTNNISLFLIPSSIGVEFFIDVEKDLFPLTGATINIAKFFVGEGIFKTTEIGMTNGDGRITAFLDLNKDYRFTITKDGVIEGILNKRAICEAAPCTLTLSITEATPDIYSGFSETFASQVLYNLSYDGGTKIVTFEFVDTTGLATSFRMDIIKGISNGTSTIISTQRLFTSSGSMTFTHTETTGDFTAKIFITRSPNQIIDFIKYIISEPSKVLGVLGLFVGFLIVVTVIFGFAFHPPMFIMSVPFSLTLVKLMGLTSISNGAIVVIYLLAIVAVGFISR